MLFSKKMRALTAVTDGRVVPLAEVPDEAFATELLGKGIAIDPTEGSIYAPCDATVLGVAETGHAYTLQTEQGLDILIHIGIDTVELKGKGFLPMVKEGEAVKSGTVLGRVDLDVVREAGLSTLIPILITNPEMLKKIQPTVNASVTGGQSTVLEYRLLSD